MLEALSAVDYVRPPSGYAAFYEMYYGHITAIVRKSGIEQQSVDDVADDIVTRLIEIDIIGKFDENYVIIRNGKLVPPRFKTFLDAHVNKYIMGKRDKLDNIKKHEILICDSVVDDENNRWIDKMYVIDCSAFAELEEQHLIESIRSYLSTLPPRSVKDICNLVKLFDSVVEQVHSLGKYNVRDLQRQFGVSNVAIYSWLNLLRRRSREVLE